MSCRVIHEGQLTKNFAVRTGVRQGCLLSPFLFILVIDWVMKTATKEKRNGIQWTMPTQLDDLDFADDLALLSHSHMQMQDKTTELALISAQVGLKINKRKTKILRTNTTCETPIMLEGETLEEVKYFTYLGSIVDTLGGTEADVKKRISKARVAFHMLRNVWKSKTSSKQGMAGNNWRGFPKTGGAGEMLWMAYAPGGVKGLTGDLRSFIVGLTDQDPRTGNGPLNSPFLTCATHGGIGTGETVNLTCTPPLCARRRYLFMAANVNEFFYVTEIEVFEATKPIVASATGFREFGKCDVFTDNNRTTCGVVTSPDNPLDFLLRANFSQPQTHFHPRITLRGGNCGDASQVHVYTEEKPLNAGPFDGYFRRCQVSETETPVDGVTVCSFTCDCIERACDFFGVRVFGRYGPERSLCEIELIFN
ncbi:hypothetical protein LSAT2_028559 [Lamellibrachia satsuma]|nr:hypothetical protein LSAT2_028559 [Lamellibrachia satsuma]